MAATKRQQTSADEPSFAALVPPACLWDHHITQWLHDDCPKFDAGGLVVGNQVQTASIYCKSAGVLAGVPFAEAVFKKLDCTVEWLHTEGTTISKEQAAGKEVVARITGPARNLLLGERTALNILARASGIATRARELVDHVRSNGWKGALCGTRKTTPGFGFVEKYALLVGHAGTHRVDLSSMVMLKDNHIWSAGSIAKSVAVARSAVGPHEKIEVECRDLKEAYEAATAGADIVMLDNFSPDELRRDAATFKTKFPHVSVEASGGITGETLAGYLSDGVDIISLGILSQGYPAVDFSMKLPRPEGMATKNASC